MTIEEMHVTFRELAQQMGMQTVRAILTEDIDICLNAAIVEKTKEIINSTIGPLPYNDKVSRQNVSLSPINALRSLYRKAIIEEKSTVDSKEVINISGSGTEVNPYKFTLNTSGVMLYTGFRISYNEKTLYDCRIIELEDLGQTLRDFCNIAAKDAPICTIEGDEDYIDVYLYTGRTNMPKPNLVQYIYVVEPDKVKYDEDSTDTNVDCNLPPYLHMDIVRIAVGIYLQSIGATRDTNKNND